MNKVAKYSLSFFAAIVGIVALGFVGLSVFFYLESTRFDDVRISLSTTSDVVSVGDSFQLHVTIFSVL